MEGHAQAAHMPTENHYRAIFDCRWDALPENQRDRKELPQSHRLPPVSSPF
jgi:hypothetical protein